MAKAIDELKRRCEAGGLRVERDEDYSGLHYVRYPPDKGDYCIEVWDDAEARVLLEEPFERYRGIDGFKASWSPQDGVIECNLLGVEPYSPDASPERGARLTKLGLDPDGFGRLDPRRRVEIE